MAMCEPFSSWLAQGLDVVQNEDGRDDRGCPAWAAAELDQDFPGLEQRDGAFAEGSNAGVCPVDRLLTS
jgi:hypothetical protein